ncbi:hypothetical protein QOZ80_4AG0307170 [Eleusine coracana subsp. coracana]|nr:hypothetical protein QOZ80_4AG0307170 [Eleusine coracana subsp. coracana]
MATAVATQQKFRWGELEEEDGGGDLNFLLPPRVVLGPDANGIRQVIEYRFDDDGHKVKVTTTTRTRNLACARLSRSALERRSWPKFGDAVKEDAAARLTMVSTEEIVLERPRAAGSKAEEPTTSADTLRVGNGTGVLMLCRTCGEKGAHWTSQCPYKDLVPQTESSVDRPSTADGPALQGGASKGVYRPPINKEGADRSGDLMRRRNDENSVRVNNLSEDTREPDLLELFRPFGLVTRVYVAVDRRTGVSRGFGFVNFAHREDGEKAISKLNGYGYDNLILRVEWAEPRKN